MNTIVSFLAHIAACLPFITLWKSKRTLNIVVRFIQKYLYTFDTIHIDLRNMRKILTGGKHVNLM